MSIAGRDREVDQTAPGGPPGRAISWCRGEIHENTEESEIRQHRAPAGRVAILAALAVGSQGGCTREFYREWANQDVSEAVFEKSRDPRWRLDIFSIEPPALSRFADPYDQDAPPAPPDDVATEALSPVPQWPSNRLIVPAEGTGYLELLEYWQQPGDWPRDGREPRLGPPGGAAGTRAVDRPAAATWASAASRCRSAPTRRRARASRSSRSRAWPTPSSPARSSSRARRSTPTSRPAPRPSRSRASPADRRTEGGAPAVPDGDPGVARRAPAMRRRDRARPALPSRPRPGPSRRPSPAARLALAVAARPPRGAPARRNGRPTGAGERRIIPIVRLQDGPETAPGPAASPVGRIIGRSGANSGTKASAFDAHICIERGEERGEAVSSRRRDPRRAGSAPRPPAAHEAGRIGCSLASRSRTSRSAAAPRRRPSGTTQPGGPAGPGTGPPAATDPPGPGDPARRGMPARSRSPPALPPRSAPGETIDAPVTSSRASPHRASISRRSREIGRMQPAEAIGLAGVLVPNVPPMNESEAAGLPKDYKAYKLDMQQASLLALINGRYYQYQLEQLYLAALPVTLQRFAFEPQFYAGMSPTTGVPQTGGAGATGASISGGSFATATGLSTANSFTYATRFAPTGQVSTTQPGDGGRRRQAVQQRRPAPDGVRQRAGLQLRRQEPAAADRALGTADQLRAAPVARRRPGRHPRAADQSRSGRCCTRSARSPSSASSSSWSP